MVKSDFNPMDLVDHIAVSAVIKNEIGNILVFFHNKYQEWTIPVGKVERGQSVTDALYLEVLEECGIEIIAFKKDIIKKYTYTREEKDITVELHQFTVQGYTGVPKNMESRKHSHMQFMPVSKLYDLGNRMDALDLFLTTTQHY
jgi:ADP-ribose pyrophosphatase YjhB (NUDIX family)